MECSICYMDLLDDPKYTECNHVYCINCICKIKKCSMCRRELNHVNMCREIIKQNCEIIKKTYPDPFTPSISIRRLSNLVDLHGLIYYLVLCLNLLLQYLNQI